MTRAELQIQGQVASNAEAVDRSVNGPLGLTVCTTEVQGSRVAYIDEGAGPPTVLLHGAPMTSLGFVRVIRTLREHHRVIAPDMPGFGRSE